VDSQNVWARKRLGELYVGQNKLNEALAQFEKLESAEADPRETRIKIGLISFERGDFDRAATEFNLVLAGDPDNDRARYYLGATYSELKSDDKALEQFERIPEKSDLFLDARVQIAYLLDRRDQTQKAIEALQPALKTGKTERKEVLAFLASLYRKAKDYPKAIQTMEQVVRLDPKNDQAQFQLGALYDENKNKEKSIATMKKAIELNPQNAAALNYLGYTWAEMGVQLDEAEALILRALKIEPNDGFYIDSLGWVYYQKGDYPRAVEQLERAVEITGDDPAIIEHLGDAYDKSGKSDRALGRYREALKTAKESDQIKRIREKIQRLEKRI
jgi:tetratricopeptide (TPR) repeat protein